MLPVVRKSHSCAPTLTCGCDQAALHVEIGKLSISTWQLAPPQKQINPHNFVNALWYNFFRIFPTADFPVDLHQETTSPSQRIVSLWLFIRWVSTNCSAQHGLQHKNMNNATQSIPNILMEITRPATGFQLSAPAVLLCQIWHQAQQHHRYCAARYTATLLSLATWRQASASQTDSFDTKSVLPRKVC